MSETKKAGRPAVEIKPETLAETVKDALAEGKYTTFGPFIKYVAGLFSCSPTTITSRLVQYGIPVNLPRGQRGRQKGQGVKPKVEGFDFDTWFKPFTSRGIQVTCMRDITTADKKGTPAEKLIKEAWGEIRRQPTIAEGVPVTPVAVTPVTDVVTPVTDVVVTVNENTPVATETV